MIIKSLEKDAKVSFIKAKDEVFDVVDGFANVSKEVADHLTSFPAWEIATEVPEKILEKLTGDKKKAEKDDKKEEKKAKKK